VIVTGPQLTPREGPVLAIHQERYLARSDGRKLRFKRNPWAPVA
jgi:hypothetical protein